MTLFLFNPSKTFVLSIKSRIKMESCWFPNVFLRGSDNQQASGFPLFTEGCFLCCSPDPARVVNMPSVIYVAIGLPGFIRCPVDANPPVNLVKWKKDGLPLRIDKVSRCSSGFCSLYSTSNKSLQTIWISESFSVPYLKWPWAFNKTWPSLHSQWLLHPQYPGWSQMEDGSIRVTEVTEDSLGTYTCMPYNALGSMGWSPPAPLVLKVRPQAQGQCI